MDKITPLEKFQLFNDHWNPRIITELNGQQVKIAKIEGDFVWHSHENEDELFWVMKGQMEIRFRDKTVALSEGDMLVVPRGVEHQPSADKECWILMFEPKTTVNTGGLNSDLTKENLERI